MSDELRDGIARVAANIGADPVDLATVISFETGGTFDPSIRGGAGNRHIGLIQFGPAEQAQYGASQDQSVSDQLGAVERYFKSRGFQPGMGMADLYSTVNAGSPGRYSASDAGNGGTPGTVLDKVTGQMDAHRAKAAALFGGTFTPPARSGGAGAATESFGSMAPPTAGEAGAEDNDLAKLMAAAQASQPKASDEDRMMSPRASFAPTGPVAFDKQRFAGLLSRRKLQT